MELEYYTKRSNGIVERIETKRVGSKITFYYFTEHDVIEFRVPKFCEELDVRYSKLETLDVSYIEDLRIMSCYGSKLKSINVKGCNKLKIIYCNPISNLDEAFYTVNLNICIYN